MYDRWMLPASPPSRAALLPSLKISPHSLPIQPPKIDMRVIWVCLKRFVKLTNKGFHKADLDISLIVVLCVCCALV